MSATALLQAPLLQEPGALFVGRTTHQRKAPFGHRFTYRIAQLFLDVDRLAEAGRLSRFFSVDRFNLLSFHRRDHGARDAAPLRPWAEAAWAEAGVDLEGGPIRLMCFPRILGYVFNPLSLWFGYGPQGDLRGVIYEVHNTFGDAHSYAAKADDRGALSQSAAKIFHVSPFFPTRGRYGFRLRPPSDQFSLSIRYSLDDADVFSASQFGARRALTNQSALGVFAGMPLLTFKVIAAIHWEALRVILKGGRYHRRPEPPAPVSVAHRLTRAARQAGSGGAATSSPEMIEAVAERRVAGEPTHDR